MVEIIGDKFNRQEITKDFLLLLRRRKETEDSEAQGRIQAYTKLLLS